MVSIYACFFNAYAYWHCTMRSTEWRVLLVLMAIYDWLCQIEKLGNCYDADSELAQLPTSHTPATGQPWTYNMLYFW